MTKKEVESLARNVYNLYRYLNHDGKNVLRLGYDTAVTLISWWSSGYIEFTPKSHEILKRFWDHLQSLRDDPTLWLDKSTQHTLWDARNTL